MHGGKSKQILRFRGPLHVKYRSVPSELNQGLLPRYQSFFRLGFWQNADDLRQNENFEK